MGQIGRQAEEGEIMTDHEMTKLCAESMGYKPYRAVMNGVIQNCSEHGIYVFSDSDERGYTEYQPLHNDAQALALVKRFNVKLTKTPKYETWRTVAYSEDNYFLFATTNQDLNRAICETIAKMQQEKANLHPPSSPS